MKYVSSQCVRKCILTRLLKVAVYRGRLWVDIPKVGYSEGSLTLIRPNPTNPTNPKVGYFPSNLRNIEQLPSWTTAANGHLGIIIH